MNEELQCLLSFQGITEKLLMQTNLPSDVIEKYNFLKQNTFDFLGLPFEPVTILI